MRPFSFFFTVSFSIVFPCPIRCMLFYPKRCALLATYNWLPAHFHFPLNLCRSHLCCYESIFHTIHRKHARTTSLSLVAAVAHKQSWCAFANIICKLIALFFRWAPFLLVVCAYAHCRAYVFFDFTHVKCKHENEMKRRTSEYSTRWLQRNYDIVYVREKCSASIRYEFVEFTARDEALARISAKVEYNQ